MEKIAGFPFTAHEFHKADGFQPRDATGLLAHLRDDGVTDLIVVSHGWTNHSAEARDLYTKLLTSMRKVRDDDHRNLTAARTISVLGILWPSKKFAERDLIPGGAASIGGGSEEQELRTQIDMLKDEAADPQEQARLERAGQLVAKLEDSSSARKEFGDIMRDLVTDVPDDDAERPDELERLDGGELMQRVSRPPPRWRISAPGTGGATMIGSGSTRRDDSGEAVFLNRVFRGIKAGARNLLNYFTYYKMKDRAGKIGANGLHPLLRSIRQSRPDLKIHLVGHSFGGRLITAAAMGPDGSAPLPVQSMALLQAAFSHHGFAKGYDEAKKKDGFFRRVVTGVCVDGPILITHTPNDRAVGLAYPIASGILNQQAAAIGDRNDPYGGIGRNGAVTTPEADDLELLAEGLEYTITPRKLHNLSADAFVMNHGDVHGREVAYAILAAIAST